jgi:lipopolysaccharide assembly outer membrane protein LptD (OstA)
MKIGLSLLIFLALLPLTAQENSELKHLTVGPVPNGRPAVPTVRLAAKSLEQNAGIVYLKGSVEINLGRYALVADEAEYEQDSGEIRARGNVRVKPLDLDRRGASQFGIK